MDNHTQFKSGFVTLIGRTNAGKSTLMNCLIGEKLAIISHKPQTTRNKIQGILTEQDYQIIFIDTPGFHKPKSKLGDNMLKTAETAAKDVDVVLFLVEPDTFIHQENKEIAEMLLKRRANVFLVINKIDTVPKPQILSVINTYSSIAGFKEIIPVSALKAENTQELMNAVLKYLKPGPRYFPDDVITDRPERFIISEVIREKALLLLQDEIPHGTAVEITSLSERKNRNKSDIIEVEATLFCEKESHKGIIIGKQGATLKEIGTRARADLERIFDTQFNLQLWVKVKNNWRDSDFYIKSFGYKNEN